MTQSQTLNLIEHLKQIPDYRKAKGKRHALWLVMMLVLLGTLCGYRGYRPLADFSQQHWQSLCELLELPAETRIPSYSTFRRVLQRVDFEPILGLFNQWSQRFIRLLDPTWVAADGKSLKSTLTDYSESYQNFVTTVSAFTHHSGVVLHLQVMDNQQTSEIEVVRQLIAALAGQPIVFTLDALHCQKKLSNKLFSNTNTT
jgi:DDE_Tnp_1-associated